MAYFPSRDGYTYGDVLIVPKYSDIETRADISIGSTYLGGARLPFISAPMDYVTGFKMAKALSDLGAYGVVNRFTPSRVPEENPDWFDFSLAIGVSNWETSKDAINTYKPNSICIDVAHGDHKRVMDTIEKIRNTWPSAWVIAGNVATYDGAYNLAQMGANAIRVGIGPGSACSTRENTGVGVPQLTAILDVAQVKTHFPHLSVIADGGIQYPGDIAKALAAGADAVMLGNMLAGHDETPGDILEMSGGAVKSYRGQSIFGSNGSRNAPEGVEGFVPYKGPVKDTIDKLSNYLRSSLSYVGANNLVEFRERTEFIRVSPATYQESRTRI